MPNTEQIIEKLHAQCGRHLIETGRNHHEHIRRVEKAIEWFNERLIPAILGREVASQNLNEFTDYHLNIDGVICRCTKADLKGAPFFTACFIMYPLHSSDTLGNGAGQPYTYHF